MDWRTSIGMHKATRKTVKAILEKSSMLSIPSSIEVLVDGQSCAYLNNGRHEEQKDLNYECIKGIT